MIASLGSCPFTDRHCVWSGSEILVGTMFSKIARAAESMGAASTLGDDDRDSQPVQVAITTKSNVIRECMGEA